ncbi:MULTISPECIES: hypothetical protein [Protofrankia]|uniref:Uncharacterized protein n=1 Tax=Protofrankia coriariae TaxID=1562887 RepID=A0ABR5EZT5_9ACTN|nr:MULTISPECIES: hypothetical protein [Protofrankia]KLL09982.1 hypothetical protein FrCorBMG51_21115 [Protofrankia coriariae]ONH33278.1 hypothetical protein BL254_20190 [Protofrankia sp. BMG5.30]
MTRTGTCTIRTRPRADVPADAVPYAVVVYGTDQQPVEVRLPFPTVAAAEHHATSCGLDGRVVPITFPFRSPRMGT